MRQACPMDYVDVPLRASHSLAWLLVAVHAAAIIAITAMPLPWWARLGGCALLAMNGFFRITRQALLGSPASITRIRLLQDGSCQLLTREQGVIDGLLQPAWYGSPLMIVLRVRCPGRFLSRSITLLPDSADADSLRRLRIFLRFGLAPSVGNQ